MGTIADKLSYLNTTKGKIKDSINLTGANIGNNDTFRSYSAKLRDSLVDIINNGTNELYDNFPKATGTGSEIELNNTYEAPMGIDLKGNTHQESTTGKNLLDLSEITTGTHYGLEITNNNDGSITLNGSPTAGISFILPKSFILKSGVTYCLSLGNNRQNSADAKFILRNGNTNIVEVLFISGITTYTPSADTTIDIVRIYSPAGIIYNNFTILPMLEVGNTRTEFEIYTNGASPNPDYSQNIEVVTGYNEVEVVGKNLFDGIFQQGGLDLSGTGLDTSSNIRIRTDFIEVKPNTTYIVSNGNNNLNYVGIGLYKSDKTYDDTNKIYGGKWNEFPKSFTTQSDTKYIRMSFRKEQAVDLIPTGDYKIQLEEGSTPTTYEPYSSDTYEINLGKNLLSNVATTTTTNGITFTILEDRSIKITGTATSKATIILNDVVKVLKKGDYTLSTGIKNKTGFEIGMQIGTTYYSTSSSRTITLNNDTNFIKWYIDVYSGTTMDNILFPQFEKGSQATSYSPYKTPIELCEIGDYQDEFRRSTGKNLLDISVDNDIVETNGQASVLDDTSIEFENGGYTVDATLTPNGVGRADYFYVSLEIDKTYTIRFSSDGNFTNVRLFKLDKSTQIYNFSQTTGGTYTFTATENGCYFRTWVSQKTAILNYVQLEQDSQATEYEPYGIDTWYLHKEIGKVVLDGSENWLDWSTYYSHRRYALDLSSTILPAADNEIGKIIANEYTTASAYNNYRDVQSICIQPSGYIAIYDNTYNSGLNAWKTWLSSNNVITYYALLTPTNTEITDEELISQLNAIKNAMSKKDKTYITAKYVEGNQPFKIVASALLREE